MRPFLPLALALVMLPASASAAGQQPADRGESAAYYYLLARQLADDDKPAEAIAALQKALALEPKSAELRAELAGMYARQNRVVDALSTAEEALKFDPA